MARVMTFDGPCPFALCLEQGPHGHPICETCAAVRYGNFFCLTCRVACEAALAGAAHLPTGPERLEAYERAVTVLPTDPDWPGIPPTGV